MNTARTKPINRDSTKYKSRLKEPLVALLALTRKGMFATESSERDQKPHIGATHYKTINYVRLAQSHITRRH